MYKVSYTANAPGIAELHGTRRELLFLTNLALDVYELWAKEQRCVNLTLEQMSNEKGGWVVIKQKGI